MRVEIQALSEFRVWTASSYGENMASLTRKAVPQTVSRQSLSSLFSAGALLTQEAGHSWGSAKVVCVGGFRAGERSVAAAMWECQRIRPRKDTHKKDPPNYRNCHVFRGTSRSNFSSDSSDLSEEKS